MNGTTEIQGLLQPLLDTLTAQHGWITCLLVWIGALRAAFKPISSALASLLQRAMTRALETDDSDDDLVIDRLLHTRWYRVLAFALDLVASVKLPLKLTP